MNQINGRVLVKETCAAVPELLVTVYSLPEGWEFPADIHSGGSSSDLWQKLHGIQTGICYYKPERKLRYRI